jgi:hypothetical protein
VIQCILSIFIGDLFGFDFHLEMMKELFGESEVKDLKAKVKQPKQTVLVEADSNVDADNWLRTPSISSVLPRSDSNETLDKAAQESLRTISEVTQVR